MAQKSNLNVSPYYDDFDPNNNFYKVLFNPGFPVQARELTTSQSILQNQIEDFGSHIFKQGSVVIPGNITFDNRYNAVKLNATNFGIDISVYLENFVGKTITGKISNVSATVEKIALPSTDPIDDITIYVKYIDSGNDFSNSVFTDGEALICNENITYGNTTISANTDFTLVVRFHVPTASDFSQKAFAGADGDNFIRVNNSSTIRARINANNVTYNAGSGNALAKDTDYTLIVVRSGGSTGTVNMFVKGGAHTSSTGTDWGAADGTIEAFPDQFDID